MLNIEKVELQKFINIAKNRVESPIYHILLLVFAYISSFWWIGILLEDHINTWHGWNGTLSSLPTWHGWNGTLPSLPGFYVTLISIPLGLYVMYLWAWRAIVWVFFIWTITKDPKKGTITVEPLHCDGCGGLFFFSKAIQAWGYLFLSMGCVVFLDCFNYVYIQEASLFREDIMAKVGVYIILAPFLFLLQPLFFRPHLANAKWHFLDELQKDYMYSNAQDDPKVENVYYEDKYNKVMSMKVWLLDMKMTTKYLIAIGTALGPLINKLLLKIKLFY